MFLCFVFWCCFCEFFEIARRVALSAGYWQCSISCCNLHDLHPYSEISIDNQQPKNNTMATCVCVFYPEGSSGVSGSITMSQTQEDGPTVIEGTIRGLTPGQKHGISVCTYGDVRDSSSSCGTIFNPFGT